MIAFNLDGNRYYVHFAHPWTWKVEDEDGRVFPYHRTTRSTVCEIRIFRDGQPVVTISGCARCNPKDTFLKRIGRDVAFLRASTRLNSTEQAVAKAAVEVATGKAVVSYEEHMVNIGRNHVERFQMAIEDLPADIQERAKQRYRKQAQEVHGEAQ